MLGILLALLVAIIWALGEVSYSKVSKKYDRMNIYMYTYLLRSIIYLGVVILFKNTLLGTFQKEVFLSTLPIIMCDLFASLTINVAVTNGKLSIVSPIMASYPMIDIILGTLLLHEKISFLEILLVCIISFSIVFLTTHQKKDRKRKNTMLGILFAVFYMLLAAFSVYFEKTNYIANITVYDLYYYKGMIYTLTTLFFILTITIANKKIKKINFSILKGCGLTPIGNVIDSFALNIGNMTIITPISSLYATFTSLISRYYLKEKLTVKERLGIFLIISSTLLLIILKI